jgi:integrase
MRYQSGTLEEIKTKQGIVWFIRFKEGTKRPRFEVGLKSQYPTRAKASRAAQHLRDEFNGGARQQRTFGDVIAKYELEEMPERYSTRRGYMNMHRNHIKPKWGTTPLAEMNPARVRQWLKGMDLAGKTKGNILGQMRVLFNFAMLWEWVPFAVNPMSVFHIEGSTKRTKKPRVINPAQFRELIIAQPLRERTMIIGGYCLGLGASELFGLQWVDFDHIERRVKVSRGVVDGRVGPTKNQHRDAPLPLHQLTNDAFLAWRQTSEFKADEDWVFPSTIHAGTLPLNSKWIQQNVLIPAGKAIGLDFNLGWHTFRHSYKVLLERAGADLTVQRDLMRHADSHTTSQIYGEVEFDRMRDANDKAVTLAFREE